VDTDSGRIYPIHYSPCTR